MPVFCELAKAKVNLTLRLIGRRRDGYHNLLSLVAFADIGDLLFFRPGERIDLTLRGPYGSLLDRPETNLIWRASERFLHHFPGTRGGIFELDKQLPVAAGLGGGSADAAAALRSLMKANADTLPSEIPSLRALATGLGADVPVCLEQKAAIMTGIGDQLCPIVLEKPLHVTLVTPDIPVSTGDVFAALDLKQGEQLSYPEPVPSFPDFTALLDFICHEKNDLEAAAIKLHPGIVEAKHALEREPSCLVARMSGSGATHFGLFPGEREAQAAAEALRSKHPNWWVRKTTLN